MNRTIDIYSLEFNLLPWETKKELMKPYIFDPYKLDVANKPRFNGATFEVYGGEMLDGEHVIRNPFSLDIMRKVLFENGKPVKAWTVTEDNKYVYLPSYEDGTWDWHSEREFIWSDEEIVRRDLITEMLKDGNTL